MYCKSLLISDIQYNNINNNTDMFNSKVIYEYTK